MSKVVGFPTAQSMLEEVYDFDQYVALTSEALRNSVEDQGADLTGVKVHEVQLMAQHLLDARKCWAHAHERLVRSLNDSANRITPGAFSFVRGEHRIVVSKHGCPSHRLGDDWVLAEKEWASLKLCWVDANYLRYFGYDESQLIGRNTSEIFGAERGGDLLENEETVQATMQARSFREIFVRSGKIVSRCAVRFPIFSSEDLHNLIDPKKRDNPSRLFMHPIAMGCICWEAKTPAGYLAGSESTVQTIARLATA